MSDERNVMRELEGVDYIGTFNNTSSEAVDVIKSNASELIDVIVFHTPPGRRRAIAITHIEEATMMAVKSLFEG